MKPAAFALVLLAFGAAGCGNERSVSPVAALTCSDVLYGGKGKPNAIVVSDLPRRGYVQSTTLLMEDAIKLVLARRGYRAGDFRIGYQSCDDATGAEPYDQGLCERNAEAYAATTDLIGVIGPSNSGCAEVQIPVLSRRGAGPLAMVSPASTWSGLTRKTLDDPKAPDVFYPDGLRNFVRVVPSDREEGRGVALLAAQLGAKQNWDDSDDLAMMYRGPFDTAFYRALHRVAHKEFRIQRIRREMASPPARGKSRARRLAALAYHSATLPFARARMERAARGGPVAPGLPFDLTSERAARPSEPQP